MTYSDELRLSPVITWWLPVSWCWDLGHILCRDQSSHGRAACAEGGLTKPDILVKFQTCKYSLTFKISKIPNNPLLSCSFICIEMWERVGTPPKQADRSAVDTGGFRLLQNSRDRARWCFLPKRKTWSSSGGKWWRPEWGMWYRNEQPGWSGGPGELKKE